MCGCVVIQEYLYEKGIKMKEIIIERFFKAGINVIDVDHPVFQIGKERWSNIWSLVQNMEHGDLRLAELQTYSEIKAVAVKTISLDAGRLVEAQVEGRYQTTEDELIISLVDKIASTMNSMNSRYLFVYKFPTAMTVPIHTIDPSSYEFARMEHGIDEKIFSLANITESKLSVVFGRFYYDGIC